jgi:hypothetical protein
VAALPMRDIATLERFTISLPNPTAIYVCEGRSLAQCAAAYEKLDDTFKKV